MNISGEGLDDSEILGYFGEEEIENEDIEEEEISIYEDLFHKNTSSFQCLAQVKISRSSLLRDPLYQFPELEDPNLNSALWGIPLPKEYDDIGVERYKDLCKKENILPFRSVIRSLNKDTLHLKYYKLSAKAMRTICQTLIYNTHVKKLILQENLFTPEVVSYLNPLMEKNRTICVLDLKHCNLGIFGIQALQHGILRTKGIMELDLSHNDLCDEGIEIFAKVLRKNISIRKLNLSHNNLSDRTLIALRKVLLQNHTLQDLNLSWNYFYSSIGMSELMQGMAENEGIQSLNLSWNGIGSEPKTFKCIINYLKGTNTRIQHLNLSNNRISGVLLKQLRRALKVNKSIVSVNVGYNPIVAEDAEYLAETFFDKRKKFVSRLKEVDVGHTFVTKGFKKRLDKIKEKGYTFKYGGILNDYEIKGPDFQELLLNRGKYVCASMKKKKQRVDIGQVIIMIQEEEMKKRLFTNMLKKNRVKWDEQLLEQIMKQFVNEKKRINTKLIKEVYLRMYPDTQPPPPKIKKRKGKKKLKSKLEEEPINEESQEGAPQPTLEETAQPTAPLQISPNLPRLTLESIRSSYRYTEQAERSLSISTTKS